MEVRVFLVCLSSLIILILVSRGLVPRSILIPISSDDRSGFRSHTPPTPLRHDLGGMTRTSLPSSHANPAFNSDQNRRGHLTRANTEPGTSLTNSSTDFETERIYLNQINETHQYASIDLEDSIISESNESEERVQTNTPHFLLIFFLSFAYRFT